MNQPHDEPKPDDLDRLLQTWQAGRQADAERLSALQRQIAARLAAERPLGAGLERAPQNGRSTGRRHGLLASGPVWLLATAAALLIAVGSFWLGRTTGDPGPAPGLARQELADKARLFAEMRGMFGNQLQWLTEANDRVELGLAAAGETADGERPMVVKVVVERRAGGDRDWQVVWSADVIALDQRQVVAQPVGEGVLSLWAYRLPDGTVFVESDLVLPHRLSSVETATANILENNRPTEIGAFESDGVHYRILQTAAALDGGTG